MPFSIGARESLSWNTLSWKDWEPGHPWSADELHNTPLLAALSEAHLDDLREISKPTWISIVSLTEENLRRGLGSRKLSEDIQIVGVEESQAWEIAVTLTNWALTRASLRTYERDGINEFDLLTESDPCETCAIIAANNPHSFQDATAIPPIHKSCKCCTSPYLGLLE